MSRSRQPNRSPGSEGSGSDPQKIREAMREVRAIYEDLAGRPIERDCQGRTECCRFRLTGRTPQLTRGEALVAAAGWRAAGRKSVPDDEAEDGACPFLKTNGHCGIYQDRPFGCRTHYCAPAGGMMDRASIIDLIRRLEAVDESLNGDGPKPLRNAIAGVWDELARAGKQRS